MKFLVVLSIILTFLSVAIKCQQLRPRQVSCPIAENPSQVFQCLTLNPQAFVDLISKNDFKSFCHMANGYMTCMSTYIRDCLGGKAVSGILEELQDLNLKCCISPDVKECVIKSNLNFSECSKETWLKSAWYTPILLFKYLRVKNRSKDVMKSTIL